MKIQLLSDLHREFSLYEVQETDADVVVLAGDIHSGVMGVRWAKTIGKPVVYVPGNHEYYRQMHPEARKAMRKEAQGTNVFFLDDDEVIINGVRFIGSTLWTDFAFFGEDRAEKMGEYAGRRMNDFRVIKYSHAHPMEWRDSLDLHRKGRTFIASCLEREFDGPSVVVTHHIPHRQGVDDQWIKDPLTAAFASNIDELMGKPALWLFGHTHSSADCVVNGTRLVCNPRGYSRWDQDHSENDKFSHTLVLEV